MRLAFVVQRYGLEVNGGAELLCRLVAEHLARRSEVSQVTVFTSCALDYRTWANHYPPGSSELGGVRVERFQVPFPRVVLLHDALGLFTMHGPRLKRLEPAWVMLQGPYLPDLVERLEAVRHDYDAFVFYTYLYYPTVYGLEKVRERALLAPAAHDEPQITQTLYSRVFSLPRGLVFNTPEERDFVRRTFDVAHLPDRVVGCGIDLPVGPPLARRSPEPYVLSVGRLSGAKGVTELCSAFVAFKKKFGRRELVGLDGRRHRVADLRLVLVGKRAGARIPERSDIVVEGFVADDVKRALFEHAEIVIAPGRFESLSLVVLEAWAHDKAVLVNGRCAVTRGQVERASGGDSYDDASAFGSRLMALLEDPELRREQGARGRSYVEREYAWPRVEDRMLEIIRYVQRPKDQGDSDRLRKISFGIITNGRRPAKLLSEVASIFALGVPELEVLVAGDVDPELEAELARRGVRFVPERRAASEGKLGRMRNALVEQARHPIMVIADDDMLFHADFHQALAEHGPDFDALAVRIQNPDGGRFWDYATKGGPRGHRLLDYGVADQHTYVTGGLIVARREVLAAVRWDDTRGFYEDEDVDMSRRLREAGYRIGFCPAATVTHDDWRYYQRGHKVRKVSDLRGDLRRRWRTLKRDLLQRR